jgi:hypothetical protein
MNVLGEIMLFVIELETSFFCPILILRGSAAPLLTLHYLFLKPNERYFSSLSVQERQADIENA